MSDKEERIMVGEIPNDVCVHQGQRLSMEKGLETFCYKKSSGICNKKRCKIKQFVGITRQKAIEVMAKAICRQDNLLESCRQCLTQCDKEKQKNMCEHILKKRKDDIERSYFDKAEAALNALLEGVKKWK